MKDNRLADVALLVLRVVAGLIMFYYGSQKMLGWFGGNGFQPTIQGFQSGLGIPPAFGILSICAEFFGGLGLVVGFLTRVAAFGLVCNMAVAVAVKLRSVTTLVAVPASSDAALRDPLVGPAYPLLLCSVALAVLLIGAGRYSLDAAFFGRRGKR